MTPPEKNAEDAPRILLVDDEPRVLSSFRRQMRGRYDLATASSGREALDLLDSEGPFALIISDLKMPGMDGLELLSRVRERHPFTLRIMLTGHADLENAISAVNRGSVFRILTKPCSPEDLHQAISDAMEQRRLIRMEQEVLGLRRVKEALEGAMLGFTALVEARDLYTAGHQRRVADLAGAIGRKLGLDEDRIAGLSMAAAMHDIGKVYVPAEFLNKPTRLTPQEFEIIKTHPLVGRDVLVPVDLAWPVSEMVHQHHERLDGSGYPQGLAGEAILLEARIIAVADVMDAMSNRRPYRDGLGIEATLEELETHAGSRYDPEAAAACVRLVRERGYPPNSTRTRYPWVSQSVV